MYPCTSMDSSASLIAKSTKLQSSRHSLFPLGARVAVLRIALGLRRQALALTASGLFIPPFLTFLPLSIERGVAHDRRWTCDRLEKRAGKRLPPTPFRRPCRRLSPAAGPCRRRSMTSIRIGAVSDIPWASQIPGAHPVTSA